MKTPTLNNDALPISGAINEILTNYASVLNEIERLMTALAHERRKCEALARECDQTSDDWNKLSGVADWLEWADDKAKGVER